MKKRTLAKGHGEILNSHHFITKEFRFSETGIGGLGAIGKNTGYIAAHGNQTLYLRKNRGEGAKGACEGNTNFFPGEGRNRVHKHTPAFHAVEGRITFGC